MRRKTNALLRVRLRRQRLQRLSELGISPAMLGATLETHDNAMRDRGFDPELIGAHEIPPVLCPHCRCEVPWRLIKGYRP